MSIPHGSMTIRPFTFCIFLCIVLNAPQSIAGGYSSRMRPDDEWLIHGDTIFEMVKKQDPHRVARFYFVAVRYVVDKFFPNGDIWATNKHRIEASKLNGFAKEQKQHVLHGVELYDPEKDLVGKVLGFFEDGSYLLKGRKHNLEKAWRSYKATELKKSMRDTGYKTNTNCDTRASETRVELSILKTDCLDGKLCDEHRSPMSALTCGHFRCEECFPMENAIACLICLASKASGQSKASCTYYTHSGHDPECFS